MTENTKISQVGLEATKTWKLHKNKALNYVHHLQRAGAVKLLLDHGANPNVRDKDFGRTPLHYAAKFRAAKIVNALCKAGADRTLKDDKGRSAQDYISRTSHAFDEIRRRQQK